MPTWSTEKMEKQYQVGSSWILYWKVDFSINRVKSSGFTTKDLVNIHFLIEL
jgi:hypothetical protein